MINVGIVGGTGHTGVEMLRLLHPHPEGGVRVVTSREVAGTRIIDLGTGVRPKDPAEVETQYGIPRACPDLLAETVYGIPESGRLAGLAVVS